MNARDLRDAERLWALLENDGQDAKTALASQLLTTGFESTLRWLATKSKRLHDALCGALNVPKDRDARGQRSKLEVLADSRRALALAEALYFIARTR